MYSSEEWRPVVGWEGLYEVSSHGRVRSLDRPQVTHTGGRWVKPGRVLKSVPTSSGYLAVSLNPGRKTTSVHRLVCEAFNEPATPGKGMALHRDGDRLNNRAYNLYWGDAKDNGADSSKHGVMVNASKTECPRGHSYTPDNTVLSFRTGTVSRGCRECRRAWDRQRGQLDKSRKLHPDDPRHGTPAAYGRFKCNCRECLDAANDMQRKRRARKKAVK